MSTGRVSVCHTEIGKIGDNISFLSKKVSYAFQVLATDTHILLIVLVQQHSFSFSLADVQHISSNSIFPNWINTNHANINDTHKITVLFTPIKHGLGVRTIQFF